MEALNHIEEFVKDMKLEDFVADLKTQSAVVKELIVIGEAARNLSREFKRRYPMSRGMSWWR